MEKLVIGLVAEPLNSSVINLLNPFFILKKDIEIINNNGQIYKNFDFILYFNCNDGLEKYNRFENVFKTIGCIRHSKKEQKDLLRKHNIKTPYYIYTEGSHDHCWIFSSETFDNEELVVVKYEYGARGVCQFKCKFSDVYKLYIEKEDCLKNDSDFSFGNDKDLTLSYLPQLKNNEFYIEKFLPEIKEYRYLSFCNGKDIIYERIPAKDNWQCNIDAGGSYTFNVPLEVKNAMKPIADKLLKITNAPWLSIDFYQTENNELGVFEFQMEFGLDAYYKPDYEHDINDIKTVKKNLIESLLVKYNK